jgi:hypothetical protein
MLRVDLGTAGSGGRFIVGDSDRNETVPYESRMSLDKRPCIAIASRLLENTGFVGGRSPSRFAMDPEHGLGHLHLVESDAVLFAEFRE